MHRVTQRGAALLCAFLFICVALSSARAAPPEERVLRVAYPIQSGLTDVDEQGNYSGYTYEYLMEMAQYTGWKYEFAQVEGDLNQQLETTMRMVEDGELDLMGGMLENEALREQYSYPAASYGTSYTVLAGLQENTEITSANYQTIANLRVAVLKGAKTRRAELDDFCQRSHISPRLVECDTSDEMWEALRTGRADLLLGVDGSLDQPCTIVATFAPRPFYIVTTKGNSELTQQIDTAIRRINESDPYFATKLYEKYFGNNDSSLRFNREELVYLRQADTLKVAVMAGKEPLQSYNEKTNEYGGITVDFLRYVAEKTGLKFEFVYAATQEELLDLTAKERVDLLASIPYDYGLARKYNVAMTRPYLSSQIVMVANKYVSGEPMAEQTIAMAEGFEYANMYDSQVKEYADLGKCLEAVEKGEADYCFGNSYSIQYFFNLYNYNNLLLVPQSAVEQRLCVGVLRPADQNLLTILNKVEKSISDSELQAIIYSNSAGNRPFSISSLVREHPVGSLCLVAFTAVLVIAVLIWFQRGKAKAARRIALQNQRFQMLINLSNECIFEYNFAHDNLELWGNVTDYSEGENRFGSLSQACSQGDEGERAFYKALREGAEQKEIHCHIGDGSRRWVRMTAAVVRDDAGQPVYTIGKLADVQSEVEARHSLEERATRDGLTGAYNAVCSRQMIERRLAQGGQSGAMLIVDLDYFKNVNDQYGHYSGDLVLIELVKIMRQTFRREDIVGRLGGDEFIAYLQGVTDREVLGKKCRQLNERVRQMNHGVDGLTVHVSIGGVMVDGQSYEELYRLADSALYLAKGNGRDRYHIL